MQEKKKEDLRIKKTKRAIRTAFEDMICEMDYEEISIKELTARAEINRKPSICIIRIWTSCLRNIKTRLLTPL